MNSERTWYKYHVLSLFILHTLHPALEDGTDRGFRNVGKLQSDAGEIPKRIHTKITRLCLREVTSNSVCLVRFYIFTLVHLTFAAFLDLTLCSLIQTFRSNLLPYSSRKEAGSCTASSPITSKIINPTTCLLILKGNNLRSISCTLHLPETDHQTYYYYTDS